VQEVAGRAQIQVLAEYVDNPPDKEKQKKTGSNAQDVEAWLDGLIATHRYVADVWPS
jgi:hypothetical protein